MNKLVCDKCGKPIIRGIRLDGGINKSSSTLKLYKWTGEGKLIRELKYDLCRSCTNSFDNFINIKDDEIIKDDFTKEENTSTYKFSDTEYTIMDREVKTLGFIKSKTHMTIGDVTICTSKIFNKFEKFMWKKCFGVDIEIKED